VGGGMGRRGTEIPGQIPGPGQTDRRTGRHTHTHKTKPIHLRYAGCNYWSAIVVTLYKLQFVCRRMYWLDSDCAEKMLELPCWSVIRIIDCLKTDKPQLLYPEENRTEIAVTVSSRAEFACIGLVGPPQSSCDPQRCAIGWRRTVDRRTVPVSDDTNERVHFVTETE